MSPDAPESVAGVASFASSKMTESGRLPPREIDPLLAELDPLILEAATEVDGTLLDWALGLSPRERLRASTRAEAALRKFVHAPPLDR